MLTRRSLASALLVVVLGSSLGCTTRITPTATTPVLTATQAITLEVPTTQAQAATPVRTTVPLIDDLAATQTAQAAIPPTPTFTPTPSPVPPGVLALMFYPPLILLYDPAVWRDESPYPAQGSNQLQAVQRETCRLAVAGGSGMNPGPTELLTLGDIAYSRTTYVNDPPGQTAALYLELASVPDYDYANPAPVLALVASSADWEACQALGETVLATLQVPN